MDSWICFIIALCLCGSSHAGVVARDSVVLTAPCGPAGQLLVASGNDVASLVGIPVGDISLFRFADRGLSPITFQIDQKDSEQRYVLPDPAPNATLSSGHRFDDNDELVFRTADAGARLPGQTQAALGIQLVEIEITGADKEDSTWVYAGINPVRERTLTQQPVRYMADRDLVQSELYRIGFSRPVPFLIESFRWKLDPPGEWSPDIVDTMKLRHTGRFLGFIPFLRTHDDYSSELLTVKQGPLRVIRRTENRVRIFWELKTPALYVDYVMMPDGFIMDTIVDIPFNVGLFFDGIETLTTMDWSEDPALPGLTVSTPHSAEKLLIDGRMSAGKELFNTVKGTRFAVDSAYGAISVHLDIPEDFPIEAWLYLRDAMLEADPPENRTGQFGNVGFRTTRWERIDTEVHHLKFTVCMDKGR